MCVCAYVCVQFADGVVDNWPIADFRRPISAPADIEYDGATFETLIDDPDSEHARPRGSIGFITPNGTTNENIDFSASSWTCASCTVVHEGKDKARFLSCEVCETPRDKEQTNTQRNMPNNSRHIELVEEEDV